MADTFPEEKFIREAINGNNDAFMSLVKQYDADLRRLTYSMLGNASAMDDVLQSAYLKAYKSLSGFRFNSSFKTWIFRIAHNSAMDYLRKNSRAVVVELVAQDVEHMSKKESSVDERLDVLTALGKLSESQRAAVLLVDAYGFDYSRAAEVLGVPQGTVASRVHSARIELRKTLSISSEGKSND